MAGEHFEERLRAAIRDVPDFPKAGIVFKDVSTLLRDRDALRSAIRHLAEPHRSQPPDYVVGIEARGFPFAAGMAMELDCGMVMARKPGKLPAPTVSTRYALEYGEATLHMHRDALAAGDRVVIVDDVLATGGTAAAAIGLVRQLGAEVGAISFLLELEFLQGRAALSGVVVHSLLRYEVE